MNAEEFVIKKFEKNYPELIKLIDEWTKHSIDQNWDCLKVLLGRHTMPNAPESVWDDKLKANKEWYYFTKIVTPKLTEYFLAKGFKLVTHSYPITIICPNKSFYSGHVVNAYYTIPDKYKS